ncbi:hypothetical protein D3C80_1163480 [compost metagenome]
MANSAPTRASSKMSPVSEANSTFTPWACVMGAAACTISSRARMIKPSPIPTRPNWPTRVCLRERKKITPRKISSGDSHDRSKVSTLAMSAVPTSAPSMIARAGVMAIRPWPTKDVTSMAVALLLCTIAVTRIPAMNARGRLFMFWLMMRRRSDPNTRRMPVRTICVPQTNSVTAESRLSRVSMAKPPVADGPCGPRSGAWALEKFQCPLKALVVLRSCRQLRMAVTHLKHTAHE